MKLYQLSIILWLFGINGATAAETNPPLATEITEAADHGDANAQFQLARACLRGDGVPKDEKKAYDLMALSAAQGNADAIGGLGYFYSTGLVVGKDEKLALKYFRKGAEKNSAKAQLNLSKYLLEGKAGTDAKTNRDEGLQWIRRAVDQKLPEAALSYGLILYYGDHGLSKDEVKAASYLIIAGDNGFADAQNILGVMSESGKGMPKDAKTAKDWFRKAALQGHTRAQCNLGRSLSPLNENRTIRIEALAWLLMSEGRGDTIAAKTLDLYRSRLKEEELEEASKRVDEMEHSVSK